MNRIFALRLIVSVIAFGTLTGCMAQQQLAQEAQARAAMLGDKGVTVYAAGDVADCKKRPPKESAAAKTAALIEAGLEREKDAAVLMLGDATYPIGMPEEFENCYQPTWGRFKQRTYPTPGNHEYYTPEAIGYYGYFDNIAGPGRRGYYSVDIGTWHVISLNSNLKPTQNQAQLEWLKEDLDRNKAHCTLAFWHHAMFSSGGHGSDSRMEQAWKLLAAAGADVVLSGHDHDYERFVPKDADGKRDDAHGMREFVVGTGGAKLTPLTLQRSGSAVSDNSTYGVLKLTLKQQGYEWEFLPVDAGGFKDHGAALCH
ncbi:MAG TPA: metallophosphoesterase [Noviherbaspirillum sp.]